MTGADLYCLISLFYRAGKLRQGFRDFAQDHRDCYVAQLKLTHRPCDSMASLLIHDDTLGEMLQ